MATTPQGDNSDVRRSVMYALARSIARQRSGNSRTAGAPVRRRPGPVTGIPINRLATQRGMRVR